MSEYIERERLLDEMSMECDTCDDVCAACVTDGYIELVKKQPAIDPESLRPKSEWRYKKGYIMMPTKLPVIECQKCGCMLDEGEFSEMVWNYCPVCGAKMEDKTR